MKSEKSMLQLSAIGGLFFAVIGTIWGILISSSMILFDGLYSLISLFLSIICILISNYIEKSDYEKFPFGKGIFEPLMVVFHSIVLIIMCLISFVDGIKDFVSGGSIINVESALAYSFISSVGCGVVYFILSKNGNKISSEIVRAESNQWLMDTVLSGAVLIGFAVSLGLSFTSLAYYTRYIDSIMVIATSSIFIKIPLKTLYKNLKEVLNEKADNEINNEIYTIVKDIEKEYKFEESVTRVSKVGRELRIEIDFVFNDKSKLYKLDQMDMVREKVYKGMDGIKFDKWLNVNFTGDKKWAL